MYKQIALFLPNSQKWVQVQNSQNLSLQSNSIDVCMKLSISCIIKAVTLLFLLESLQSFECDPSFSQKYCQMLRQANMSFGKNSQCHKQDQKCPLQTYKNFSRPPTNYLIMEIKAKKKPSLQTNNKHQQPLTFSQVTEIILEELMFLFAAIVDDILQQFALQKIDSPSIQYSDNFASLDGGAMILRLSSNKIKAAQSILEYNSDRYLYTDEVLPLEIVIALKQQVSIQRIVIKSSEIYSSIMNEFIVYGAIALNNQENDQDNWSKLVQAKAKNEATQQQYRTIKKVVRYLKLKVISAHGDWKYFTITQFKVYGSSVYAEAMTNYQSVNNEYNLQPGIDTTGMHLYQDLKKMILLAREGNKTIPQNNLITYFFQQLQKLTKIQEHQILYLNNLTLKIKQLQNKTEQAFKNDKTPHQQSNKNISGKQALLQQKDWIYYKQIYQRQCQSPINGEQLLANPEVSQKQPNKTKQKTQSFFRLLELQKDSLQNQEIRREFESLKKQLKQMQSTTPLFSQMTLILINVAICIVISMIVASIYLRFAGRVDSNSLQKSPKVSFQKQETNRKQVESNNKSEQNRVEKNKKRRGKNHQASTKSDGYYSKQCFF